MAQIDIEKAREYWKKRTNGTQGGVPTQHSPALKSDDEQTATSELSTLDDVRAYWANKTAKSTVDTARGNKLPEGFFDNRPTSTQSTPETVKATVGDFVQAIGGMGNKSGRTAEEEAFQVDLTSIASDGKITLEDIRKLHELHPAATEENAYGLYSLYASRLTEDELKREAPTISQELYNLYWTPEMQTEYDGLSEVTNAVNAKKATANPTNFDQKGVRAKQTTYTPTEEENNAVKRSAEMAVAKNNAESAKSYMEYLLSREWERSQYKKKYGQEWYDASGKISDNETAGRIVIDMLKDRYNRQAESGSGYATPYELDEMYKKASRGEATVEDVKKVAERYSDTKLTDEDVARLGTMYKDGKSGAWSDYYEDFVYPRVSDEVRRKKSAEYDAVAQNGNFGERLVSSVGGLLSSVGLSVPAAIESVDSAITSNIKKADFPVYKENTGYGRLSSMRTGIDEGRKVLGTDINADVLESFGMEREKAEAIGGTAYDIENSIAENLVRMPLGATFGSFVMLSQSFASEYQGGVDRFEDPTKNAVRSGILSALEAGTEAIQIKGLEKARLKNTAFEPNLIKRIGKGAVLGGVNETPSELVNYYSGVGLDILLNGENSDFYKEMYSRVASGKNDSYAGAAASILAEGTGNTALSSFISGGFLGGINSTFSYSGKTRADLSNFGKKIQDSGVDFNLLIEQAKTSKTDVTRELARSIEAAQKKGKTIPDEALGMLYYYAENDAQRGEIDLKNFAESMAFSSLGRKIIDDGISNDVIASALNSSNSETAKKARALQGKSGAFSAEEIGSLCQAVADDLESGAITEDGLVGKVKDNYAKKPESTPSPKKATPEAYETESVTIYTGKKKTPKNAEGKYIGDMNGARLIAVDGSYYSQNGRTFVVNAESGAVVTNGNSFESAVNKVRSNSEFVEASYIEEDTDTTEDTVSPENDIPDEDIAEEDIAVTDEEDAVEETAEETDHTDYRTAPNIQNEEEYKSLPRKAKAHAVIGRSIAESDFENDIIEMGLDADNSGARNIANSLRNNSDMSDVTRYVALGDLASRLGVTREQIVKSKARSLAFQFASAISSESGATFAERVEAAIPNARKTATARNDKLTLDAIKYLESVVSDGGTAIDKLIYSHITDTQNFTKENPNIAVERYAQKMQSALRASGTKINVVVAYDMPIGARGDWTTKNGVTTIRLNGKALRGEASAFWVMSHELLHEAETYAPGITDRILDTFEDMGIYTDGMYEAYRQKYKSSYEAAYKGRLDSGEINQAEYDRLVDRYVKGEIAADLMSECFTSRDMLEMFAGKLTIEDRNIIVRFLRKIFEGLKKAFGETDAYTARFEAIVSEFENAIKSGSGTNVGEQTRTKRKSLSSIGYSFFGNENISADEVERMLEDGSYKDYEGYKKYVDDCVKVYKQAYGRATEADIAQIEKEIEGIMRVAVAAKRAGYDIFDSGEKRNITDSKDRLLFSSLEPNSDYITSSDISTICDKRMNFAEIYDDIVRLEEQRGVPEDERFFHNVDNYFIIHKIMADKGLTVPCEECYVESMRKNLAPMAEAFITLVKESDDKNKSNPVLYHQDGKDKGKKKKNNAELRNKVRRVCAEKGFDVNSFTLEMLSTAEGLAQLRLQQPLLYEAFNSFYGQSKPKMPREATPFRPGELIALLTNDKGKINTSLLEKIKSTGGFRLQSYSDFQIKNYVDVLQTIFEASMLGLNGHAYTKVPAFLQATEGTNLKRNLSIFMYDDNGTWTIDKKNSFPMELEDIYALVAEDESGNTSIIAVSQNEKMSAWVMANDLIGYSIPFHKSGLKMEVVRARVVKTKDGREVLGYAEQKDHTSQQNEVYKKNMGGKKKEGTKVTKPINIYSFWDFDNKDGLSQKELIEKNLKKYIDECEKAFYRPKFREYLMDNEAVLNDVLRYAKELGSVDENATIDDISFEYGEYRIPYGYYKFLGDFGMFTPDGEASPIKPLSLAEYDFDKAVEFFADSKKLRTNELLQQFENGAVREKYRKMVEDGELTAEQLEEIIRGKRGEVVREVVDGERRSALFGEDLTSDGSTTSPDTRFALSNPIAPEMDTEYLELAKNPEKNEARLREMVEEAARGAGYDSPLLYHGTPYFGFTQIDTKKSSDRISFFATDSIQVAGTYSGKKDVRRIGDTSESSLGTYQLYANTDGMVEFDANGAEHNHIALGRMERAYNDFVLGKVWYAFATVKQLAKFAKNKGYTGVIIKNVVDTATPESRKTATPATVYIFFNPQSQVKSADLITYDDDGNIVPLSERFNPESVDIRNALSNTEVLEELVSLQEKYGTIPSGEKPVRNITLPKKTSDKKYLSQSMRTLEEAGITPEKYIPEFDRRILNGMGSYERIPDGEAKKNAEDFIRKFGFDGAMREWESLSRRGDISKYGLALGMTLYNQCITSGDVENAMKIAAELAVEATRAGQMVQAFRLIKQMSPDGQLYHLEKTIERIQDEFSRRGNKFGDENDFDEAIQEARRTAGEEMSKVYKSGRFSKRGGKFVFEGNADEESLPFVQQVGQEVAKSLEAMRHAKAEEKTFLEHIASELKKFAQEKIPKAKKGQALTAVDIIRDYIQNQEFYSEAWEIAQETLRAKYSNDIMLGEFVNSGIGVDANFNLKNAIFMKALVQSAIANDETKANIIKQSALGVTKISDNIAESLISATGAEGEIAETIRDAATSYVYSVLANSKMDTEKFIDGAIRRAMKDIGTTLSNAVVSGKTDNAKQAIIEKLVTKYAFGITEATYTADIVAEHFDAMSKQYAQKRLEKMFAKKPSKKKATKDIVKEQLELLGNLGAFDIGSEYNSEAAKKVFRTTASIHIDEELAKKFLKAQTPEAREKALDEIYNDVASQIPATFSDKWRAWRYLAMLGNTLTHSRNIFGNAIMVIPRGIKNYIGAAMEKGIAKEKRTKSFHKSKAAVEFAKSDFKEVEKLIKSGGKYSVTGDINDRRTIFKTKWLEALRKKNYYFLELEDSIFLKAYYVDSLARIITARGLDTTSIDQETLDSIRELAINDAQESTYRDDNALAEYFNALERAAAQNKFWGVRAVSSLSEGLMPFKKTPLNIAKQGIYYSPYSVAKGIIKGCMKLKNNEAFSANEVIDDLAKGLTGSMIIGLGYVLAAKGIISGAPEEEEKEKKQSKAIGEQNYALVIGDHSYTINWMAPACLPLFVGVELFNAVAKDEDISVKTVLDALSSISEPLLELSVLSGIDDALSAASYNETNKAFAVISDMLTSYALQGLPTIGGQISRLADDNKRNYYYVDKNSWMPKFLQQTIGQAASKVPAVSYLFPKNIDVWGREEKYGNFLERLLENTISPGYYSKRNETKVDKEILELYKKTDNVDVFPTKQNKYYKEKDENGEEQYYYFTADEYEKVMRTRGRKSYALVSDLISDKKVLKNQNKKYSEMTDEEKVRAIRDCYEIAGTQTKEEVLPAIKKRVNK